MSQYDPHELGAPVRLIAKLELRKLYGKQYQQGWDQPLPKDLQINWVRIFEEALQLETIQFPRAVRPMGAETLQLVAFFDGSLDAFATVLYARWTLNALQDQAAHETRILCAKTRVAPLTGTTIYRMELQALVQATRSLLKVVKALATPVQSITLVGDSLCAIMAVRNEGTVYAPYFQNRVAEVQNNLQELRGQVEWVDPIHKIDGFLNPADLATRGRAKLMDLQAGSDWQRGPTFLNLSREQWPIYIPEYVEAVPEKEYRKVARIHFAREHLKTHGSVNSHGSQTNFSALLD